MTLLSHLAGKADVLADMLVIPLRTHIGKHTLRHFVVTSVYIKQCLRADMMGLQQLFHDPVGSGLLLQENKS